jgi:hypothetical protein
MWKLDGEKHNISEFENTVLSLNVKTTKGMRLFSGLIAFALLVSLASCNRKPEPSFEANFTKAKLGQPIRFTDNSSHANSLSWDFGNGIIRNGGREQVFAYDRPGAYTVTLKAWNKKEKKEANTTRNVSIDAPTKDEIVGTWFYFKREDIKTWDPGRDRQTVINEMPVNQIYFFEPNDTMYINDFGTNLLLRRWAIDAKGDITIDTNIFAGAVKFQVVKLFNGEMILRDPQDTHDRLLYFKR